jgi:hypothetical protein
MPLVSHLGLSLFIWQLCIFMISDPIFIQLQQLDSTQALFPSKNHSTSLGHREERSPQAQSVHPQDVPGGNVWLSWWISLKGTGCLSMSILGPFVPFSLLWICLYLAFFLTDSVSFCHSPFYPLAKLLSQYSDNFPPALEPPILKVMCIYR